jgi:hypothetical protein
MKHHLWADPNKKWEGFHFEEYFLDPKRVWALPLTEKRAIEGPTEKVSTTLGDLYRSLVDRSFKIDNGHITTDAGEVVVSGSPFACHMLDELLDLRQKGADPLFDNWFWYDSNSCMDDPHEMFTFFVVHDGRIVGESVSFSDYSGCGFDPDVFQTADASKFIWSNDSAWVRAKLRFWYRKFYTETITGQMMLLRPDEPEIYEYESKQERGPDTVAILLKKIHVLLWVLVVLGGLILIRLLK